MSPSLALHLGKSSVRSPAVWFILRLIGHPFMRWTLWLIRRTQLGHTSEADPFFGQTTGSQPPPPRRQHHTHSHRHLPLNPPLHSFLLCSKNTNPFTCFNRFLQSKCYRQSHWSHWRHSVHIRVLESLMLFEMWMHHFFCMSTRNGRHSLYIFHWSLPTMVGRLCCEMSR